MRILLPCCALSLFFASSLSAADVTIVSPVPHQVIQREGYDPRHAGPHEPGGPKLGHAIVPLTGTLADIPDDAKFETRITPLAGAWGRATEWTALDAARSGENWSGALDVAAGGWYRLELRITANGQEIATAQLEPFGVGEVFVIAGQSYAAGANDELKRIADPLGRVAAFDVATGAWQVAHDPQPGVGDGGTIWPCLGNSLSPIARVPIGFVNVASGGTASRQWLPGETLYENLAAAGKRIGRFRAVLWQQGESDVIEKIPTDVYVSRLVTIRANLAVAWEFEPVWLLAKSTLHPTVYNEPEGESRIRAAIDRLCEQPGFRPGPDTDVLDGEDRGGPMSRRHFSAIGQERAGLMWFAAVWAELNRVEPTDVR